MFVNVKKLTYSLWRRKTLAPPRAILVEEKFAFEDIRLLQRTLSLLHFSVSVKRFLVIILYYHNRFSSELCYPNIFPNRSL